MLLRRDRVGARSSDEELLALVAAGKAPALEELYDRYDALLYSLALRVVRDRGAAEEIVQDAFVAVWRKAGTFDPARGRAYTWLVGITRNRAVDEIRRRRTRGMVEAAPELFPNEVPGPPDPEGIEAVELREGSGSPALVRAVEELPGEQRTVLEMAYFGGLSQREISERTGVPLGTVKTRTRLALAKLRLALGPSLAGSVAL